MTRTGNNYRTIYRNYVEALRKQGHPCPEGAAMQAVVTSIAQDENLPLGKAVERARKELQI